MESKVAAGVEDSLIGNREGIIRLGLGFLFEAGVFLLPSLLSELVVIEDILEDRTGDGTAATSELLLLFLSRFLFPFEVVENMEDFRIDRNLCLSDTLEFPNTVSFATA